ncbi:MAG TPA: pantoate--beta-alanine ligase [Stellaceae bacterium]|nr:pantoate--beta-alanine ligase [Stellaceae bacterium]
MRVVRTIAELRQGLAGWRRAGERIGLVPTMGALHAGHMALVAAARGGCERVAASIFVNPKQFTPSEDLGSYPRPHAADLEMLRSAGIDLAYLPGVDEIYPPQFSTVVRVGGLSEGLCGAHRAGHFDGVATVVSKLLIQSLPDLAYFGEKDYQQLLIVRRLARDLDLPVRIEGVPIVREPDGLALSSRNAYLSAAERRIAPGLCRVLRDVAAALERDPIAVGRETERGRAELARSGFDVEYLEIRAAEDLAAVGDVVDRPCRVLAAAYLGRTRLIDNFPIVPATTALN